jgi:hypothetical protein
MPRTPEDKESLDFALCSTTGNHVTHAEVRYRRYRPRWEEHTVCKLVAKPMRDCLSLTILDTNDKPVAVINLARPPVQRRRRTRTR